ncbi:MAG: hypothetical protein IJO52_05080, partial [Clostridia bacterium]|nr:hypothetical protein [Clostridia bacterium]
EAYMDAVSGNAPLRDKISKRYLDAVRKTAILYDTAQKDIRDSYKQKRNALGAQAALARSNNALDLSQKGLSKSGESVQSAVLGDMALMSGLTQLNSDESHALNELSKQRQQAMSGMYDSMAKELIEADEKQQEQDYKKQRDAIEDERWDTEFKYKASQDSVKSHQWEREFEYGKQQDLLDREHAEKRDEEDDRRWNAEHTHEKERDAIENERWEREFARSNYENDRDYKFEVKKQEDKNSQLDTENELARDKFEQQKKKENSELGIKGAYLAMEREYKEREMKLDEEKADLSHDRIMAEIGVPYRITEDGYIDPVHTPDEFIDIMLKGIGDGTLHRSEYVTRAELKERLEETILNNPRLSPDFRESLRIYAKARGLLD